jgi:hypothetical protein
LAVTGKYRRCAFSPSNRHHRPSVAYWDDGALVERAAELPNGGSVAVAGRERLAGGGWHR